MAQGRRGLSSLKSRVNNIYAGTISDVSSRIVIIKDDKTIKKVCHGTNKNKVIEIAIRF